jgi:hypothetical protein
MGNCICNRQVAHKTAINLDDLNNDKIIIPDNSLNHSNRDKKNTRGLNPQQGSFKALKSAGSPSS